MQDIPDKATLLAAVRRFLKTELAGVVPDPALRFRVLIAANLLGVVERELSLEPGHHTAEVDRLASLLSEAEVEALRTLEGEEARRAELASLYDRLLADESVDRDALFGHVKATLAEKLAVVNPRFDLSPTIE
ncbi:MAG: DUF6285 domain-containing protein [Myxococcota bacterium]|jgi:hypothetical protein|nr:DUF6285 domain-containing protein [Myxococcota bacterium]